VKNLVLIALALSCRFPANAQQQVFDLPMPRQKPKTYSSLPLLTAVRLPCTCRSFQGVFYALTVQNGSDMLYIYRRSAPGEVDTTIAKALER
jgi:hypothetical protein